MKEKNIALIGAFDRYNYGDVLMPLVLSRHFRLHYPYEVNLDYFGLRSNDLRNIGGVKCRAIKDFYKHIDSYDAVIVVGGEVLAASYSSMLPMIMVETPRVIVKTCSLFLRCLSHVNSQFANNLCRAITCSPARRPWIIEGHEHVYYNSVGGARGLFTSPQLIHDSMFIKRCLQSSSYLSVRSIADFDALRKANVEANLCPDSVTAMSLLWSIDNILQLSSQEVSCQIANLGSYFVFQINLAETKKHGAKAIAEAISKACDKSGLNCLLVPIGLAPMHDDDIALRKIHSFAKKNGLKNIHLLSKTNVYDITIAIASSCCFIGTSLHGCVVSNSFGIPHTTIERKDSKTSGYIKSWKSSILPSTSISEISSSLNVLLSKDSIETAVRSSKLNKMAAFDNLGAITGLIAGQ